MAEQNNRGSRKWTKSSKPEQGQFYDIRMLSNRAGRSTTADSNSAVCVGPISSKSHADNHIPSACKPIAARLRRRRCRSGGGLLRQALAACSQRMGPRDRHRCRPIRLHHRLGRSRRFVDFGTSPRNSRQRCCGNDDNDTERVAVHVSCLPDAPAGVPADCIKNPAVRVRFHPTRKIRIWKGCLAPCLSHLFKW
jgi:hypothetical protein